MYVELCFATSLVPGILDEFQVASTTAKDVATLKVDILEGTKRAVVMKEDDLLSKKDLQAHREDVPVALAIEIRTWLVKVCFKLCLARILATDDIEV